MPKLRHIYTILLVLVSAFIFCNRANATLIEFWNDAAGWQNAVTNYKVVDFTDLPPWTPITNQYSGFTVTNSVFIEPSANFYGIVGVNGIKISFATPIHALAVDHLGTVQFDLFREGKYITTSVEFNYAMPGGTFFSGIISDVAFDEVYMFKPQPPFSNNVISVDALYWGFIPTPGALPLLSLLLLTSKRRRRSP